MKSRPIITVERCLDEALFNRAGHISYDYWAKLRDGEVLFEGKRGVTREMAVQHLALALYEHLQLPAFQAQLRTRPGWWKIVKKSKAA